MTTIRVFAALLFLSASAWAQFYSINGTRWSSPLQASLDTMITHSIQRKALEQSLARRPQAAPAPAQPEGASEQSFAFRYSGRPIAVQSLADSIGQTPQQKKEFAQIFGAILEQMTAGMRDSGDPYDVSKALAMYTASMYSVLHPELRLESFDDAASDRLLNQVRWQILHEPAVRTADAKAKQALWEGLVIFAGFAHAGYEQCTERGDKEGVAKIRLMAEEGLRSLYQVEPARLRLNPAAAAPLSIAAR